MKERKADLYIFDSVYTIVPEALAPIDDRMAYLLGELLKRKKVAIISGGPFDRIKNQVLLKISHFDDDQLGNLFLLPSFGSSLFKYQSRKFHEVYSNDFLKDEAPLIVSELCKIATESNISPGQNCGKMIDVSQSLITFAALGQGAPLSQKRNWDPKQKKRNLIKDKLVNRFPRCEIKLAGHTSINITKKGINKMYGIQQLRDYLQIPLPRIVFIGDSFFNQGNDEAVKKGGVSSVQVKNVKDTENFIEKTLVLL